ncbi:MAG: type II secretion system protein [Eubacterium sp.]|nr:type II secretion system protein [Eubacterium sp.]
MVELIIIVAIMAILAGTIGLAVIRYIEKARIAQDLHNGSLIKNALSVYPFPSDFQGRDVWYEDPITHEQEHFRRGWVYVDKDEIRCSDQSTALALIYAGLVHVSLATEDQIASNEEDSDRWFPDGPDGDYIRRTAIGEYAFKNSLTVRARTTWNTYQLDVYIDDDGQINLGASASNQTRVEGHSKDEDTAKYFAQSLGFYDAKITPIGEQNSK